MEDEAWTSVTLDDFMGPHACAPHGAAGLEAGAGPLRGEAVAQKSYAVAFPALAGLPAADADPGAPGTLYITSARLLFVPFNGAASRDRALDTSRMALASVRQLGGGGGGGGPVVEITTKTGRSLRLGFPSVPQLLLGCGLDISLAPAFNPRCAGLEGELGWATYSPQGEYERLGLGTGPASEWRHCDLNADFRLAPTYPSLLVLPKALTDAEARAAANFRSKGRLPAVAFRYPPSGATITRCAQPLVGLAHNRCPEDELLFSVLQRLSPSNELVVMDCRSASAALGNRAIGGGTEAACYYGDRDVLHLGLDNIHAVRESGRQLFEAARAAALAPGATPWLAALENSRWLEHIERILAAAVRCADAVAAGTSVLVHCSDGWDRTPQVAALAELLLDPYYRTLRGFAVLVEKEWCSFGHQFAVRCGHARGNVDFWSEHECSPVFLQFLDCVWQLTRQFPRAFEFSGSLLAELYDVVVSGRSGTFLGNCERERAALDVRRRTPSAWTLLELGGGHRNPYYEPAPSISAPPPCAEDGGGRHRAKSFSDELDAVVLTHRARAAGGRLVPDTRPIALDFWAAVHAPGLAKGADVGGAAAQLMQQALAAAERESASLREQLAAAQRRSREDAAMVQRMELQLRRALPPGGASSAAGGASSAAALEVEVCDTDDGALVTAHAMPSSPEPAEELKPFRIVDGYFPPSSSSSPGLGSGLGPGSGSGPEAELGEEGGFLYT